MNKKGKLIFMILGLVMVLSFLTNGNVNAKQTEYSVLQVTEPEMDLNYEKNPVIYDSTYIGFWIDFFGDTVTLTQVDLTITNSTTTLLIYSIPNSINLGPNNPVFFDEINIQFNKLETWNLTLCVVTETGGPFYKYGQLEVSPFQIGVYETDDAIAYTPTEIYFYIWYEDYIPNKNIAVEVLVDDSNVNPPGTNISIYNTLHVFSSAPSSFSDTFYRTFTNVGYYILWMNVTDLDTSQQWFTRNTVDVQSINATIHQENELFVGNLTKIEIELNYYGPSEIFADAFLYIRNYYDFYKEDSYSYEWKDIQLNTTHPRFNDSIYLSFEEHEHGDYDVWLDVYDNTYDTYISDYCDFRVWNDVDLRIYHSNEIWPGEGDYYYASFDIYYFKSRTVTADIEVILDGSVIYSEYGVIFPGQTPYSFDAFYWGYNIDAYPISSLGYHEITLRVYIQETGEEFIEQSGFIALGVDNVSPVFRDISGLTNGATYSGSITITVNVTDDLSDVYNVILDVTNENFSETFYFGTETDWYIYKTYCHCYATLILKTTNIYDGDYQVTIKTEDDQGNRASEMFYVRFENGYLYEPPNGDDDDDDKISPGFEAFGLIFALIVVVGLLKRRK
jgi:hypothetical protein